MSMPMSPQIFRCAITGGPCGGKTTAMAEVSERLRSRGVNAFVVPEAATLMFTGGASVLDLSQERKSLAFQTALLKTQLALEDTFTRVAEAANGCAVLLCDRGAMDGRAYMSPSLWKELLTETGFQEGELRDARYDLVVHMVTAADGAPEFYTKVNNKTRRESEREAISQDRRTRDAWTGHAHLRIVDNRTGFRAKINRVFHLIADLIGVPAPSSWVVRKFLVASVLSDRVSALKQFNVKQTFLKRTHGTVESVRVRCDGGTRNFMHKVRFEGYDTKRQITNREYLSLLAHSDPTRRMISIKRSCFAFGSNYFVLDDILNVPSLQLVRCHVEKDGKVLFPDWLEVEREVTGEVEFTVYDLALLRISKPQLTEVDGPPAPTRQARIRGVFERDSAGVVRRHSN